MKVAWGRNGIQQSEGNFLMSLIFIVAGKAPKQRSTIMPSLNPNMVQGCRQKKQSSTSATFGSTVLPACIFLRPPPLRWPFQKFDRPQDFKVFTSSAVQGSTYTVPIHREHAKGYGYSPPLEWKGAKPTGDNGLRFLRSTAEGDRLFCLLVLPSLFAFFDYLLLRLARHLFVMAERLGVHATAARQRTESA